MNMPEMFESLLQQRRSIRGYLPDPVPQNILNRVFEAAQRSPSNCNVQPWVVHVVSGDAARRMSEALVRTVTSGAPASPDLELTGPYPGEYRKRQIGAAVALFEATGIARDDIEARQQSLLRNFRFFEAPHAAFVLMPDWASYREAADCGMYLQTLMLEMTANGLASCAQGALSHYADSVRKELGVDDTMRVLMGISFGYEDPAHPANKAITDRVSLDSAVTFHN